ncbi:MAG: SH3 domain-containing protein [Anaerolineaceae bacterium]|nr:SH3 domain-containing protein [Anaerolineaceae bacterium]
MKRAISPHKKTMRRLVLAAWVGLLLCFFTYSPAAAQEAVIITAEVANLNAGANLNIRTAPTIESNALLLVPIGTELEFLGMNETREWAFIHYVDEEGTELRGWVSADYIIYRIEDRFYSQAQLEAANQIITVAENIQGALISESVAAVSTPAGEVEDDDQFYADVVNLNPDANLHIRRGPDSNSESLALVPAGSALILVGLQVEDEWAFVRYPLADGTQVSGWVSTDYVNYRYQSRYYSHNQLLQSGRVRESSDAERGGLLDASGRLLDTVDDTLYTSVSGLDIGARLHLRRLPADHSESLTLAANGASFSLLGFSEENDWAYVLWPQEDGSSYTGWVASLYLLFLHRGLNYTAQQLIDAGLAETIEAGIFGYYTDPEGEQEDVFDETVYAVVGGLDPGVRLHIRITPNVSSESLHLLPNSTSLQLIGMNEAGDWAYIRYQDDDSGGFIDGWVSALYLSYRFRGGALSSEALLNLGRIQIIEEDRPGAIEGQTSIPPSVDNRVYAQIVGLNPGANLHVRIAPDASSESLMLIPGEITVVVAGIHPSQGWAFVEVEMQNGLLSGWVSARYLQYFYRGQPYTLERLLQANYLRNLEDGVYGGLTGELSDLLQEDTIIGTITGDAPQNVYRFPDETAEILYEINVGTQVEVIALNDSLNWSFIALEMEEGLLRGWLPGNRLNYRHRNQPFSAQQLYDSRRIGRYVSPVAGSSTLPGAPSPTPESEAPATGASSADSSRNQPGNATIVNLPPDGRLAIQDAPQASAATLSLQAPGTELKLFGFNSDLSWSFIRHTQPDGTTISGWAPTEYLELSHPASPASVAIFLLGDGLLRLIDDSFPGSVIAGASHRDLYPPIALIEAESASGNALGLRERPSYEDRVLSEIPGPARATMLAINDAIGWAYLQYDEPSGRNVLGWLPLAELQLYVNSEKLAADPYAAAQAQYQIPFAAAELSGAASP